MRTRSGNVEPRSNGTWRVRVTLPNGKRKPIQTCPTKADAELFLAQYLKVAESAAPAIGGIIVLHYAERFLTNRELEERVANPKNDWSRFRNHIAPDPLARMSIRAVTKRDVKAFLIRLERKMGLLGGRLKKKADPKSGKAPDEKHARQSTGKSLATQTIRHVLNLLRAMFADACEDNIIKVNPTLGINLKKNRKAKRERTTDKWTFATPEEQQALWTAIKGPERWILAFAIGSGLRAGELVSLRLADLNVNDPERGIFVRYGGPPDEPAKSERSQRPLPLFGLALHAAREWLRVLPTYAPNNPYGLVFPRKGATDRKWSRYSAKYLKGGKRHRIREGFRDANHVLPANVWKDTKAQAGITRRFRWHDLRHTCGSSLVSGWWGHKWRLEEVRDFLGHESVTTTEMYAHLGDTVLKQAAAKTPCELALNWPPPVDPESEILSMKSIARPAGFEPATRGLEGRGTESESPIKQGTSSNEGQLGAVSAALLAADAKGDEKRAAELQKEWIELVGQHRARVVGFAADIVEQATKATADVIPITRTRRGPR